MLFFLLKKNHIFWFFYSTQKIIINHEKIKKINNLKFKSKLFSTKN